MTDCAFCQKRVLLKFMMSFYGIKIKEIADALNISDSLVRKHIEGLRYCEKVDLYFIKRCFGSNLEILHDQFC